MEIFRKDRYKFLYLQYVEEFWGTKRHYPCALSKILGFLWLRIVKNGMKKADNAAGTSIVHFWKEPSKRDNCDYLTEALFFLHRNRRIMRMCIRYTFHHFSSNSVKLSISKLLGLLFFWHVLFKEYRLVMALARWLLTVCLPFSSDFTSFKYLVISFLWLWRKQKTASVLLLSNSSKTSLQNFAKLSLLLIFVSLYSCRAQPFSYLVYYCICS